MDAKKELDFLETIDKLVSMKYFKINSLLRGFSLIKIPLVAAVRPNIIELSKQKSIVRIKLGYVTRNHLNSMYFGALAIGAELSVGVKIFEKIQVDKSPVNFIFKDFDCRFHRRAQTAIDFCFLEPAKVDELVEKAIQSGERVEMRFEGFALEKNKDPLTATQEDKIMSYGLTLSVKKVG